MAILGSVRPHVGQQTGFAIVKIVDINEPVRSPSWPGLFDVSKEIILVTGASQGLGRGNSRAYRPRSS
jgi:hypothetical protein